MATPNHDITLVEAVTLAHRRAMEEDPSVLVMGEDVGINGGVFRATDGLLDIFGKDRVMDTPLAETTIAGAAIGLATQGFRPVAEIQFMGFIYPTLDHMVNHAGRLRNRTRGRLTCPMVLRAPYGGGIHAPEHHSESVESFFVHAPGLRVVIPSTPQRAYGLLLAAIRDPDPVVFLEPKRIYRTGKEAVQDNGEALPLDRCFVEREGEHITLISWGAMMLETRKAADDLEANGVSTEVIDVACLSPLDSETILNSVRKTGRAVIIQEAPQQVGVGAEIAALLVEHALYDLIAPPQRVCGYDTVMPLPALEKHYMPDKARIVSAARHALSFGQN